jgi:sulfofructose kinase
VLRKHLELFMSSPTIDMDVLCVGHACYDLTFAVPHHPAADEKAVAETLVGGGGGPAANAAVTVARLGLRAAFAGHLGNDPWGELHFQELHSAGVSTRFVVRGSAPTPLSAILVKPDGKRTVINYRSQTDFLAEGSLDLSAVSPRVILFDGHEPHLSLPLVRKARQAGIPSVLDAGSVHLGTRTLADKVDYLVCSEKFAREFTGLENPERAALELHTLSPNVVVTLGKAGLVWANGGKPQRLPAFEVRAVDSTGAGDAFHGSLAACLAEGWEWETALRFASATAALTCTHLGARPGLPTRDEVNKFLVDHPIES